MFVHRSPCTNTWRRAGDDLRLRVGEIPDGMIPVRSVGWQ
jgi:hypothetical protein